MKVSQLMDKIRTKALVLPEFQREYVWGYEQSKQLLVSLFREFPTGSLLFWETASPPAIKNITIPPEKFGSTLVILDGQQRLTTLYLFTQNLVPPFYRKSDIRHDPRDLYFDLSTGEFLYYQVTRMQNNPTWISVVDCFSDHQVNLFAIAKQVAEDDSQAFELAQNYNNNLNRLQNIMERDYPIQTVPSTASIDDAIDVFDRVNSLGTPLSEAELALAHITGKWPEARQVMKDKIAELNNRHFEFNLTFLVRCLTGVVKGRALYETIHQTPAEELQQGWELLSKILDYLLNVLVGHANIHSTEEINTTNVLVPAVVYLARHDVCFESDKVMRQFVHWLYAASTWARYTSQTDQRLDHDIAVVQRTPNPWKDLINLIIDQRGRIEVKGSDLEGRTARHPLYRMMYILAKSQGAVDLFNNAYLDSPVESKPGLHSYRIFPRSTLYSERGGYSSSNHLHKKIVNEIANRAFSSIPINNLQDPIEYLPEVAKKYPGALEKQFIPSNPDLWELDRYEDFLAARRELIAKAFNERMQELINTLEPSEPESVNDLLQGENAAIEYKSSMRWDMRARRVNKNLEMIIAKTVAGFLNSEGGVLLIGVADDCSILGIQHDISTLGRKDLDGYEQKLQQLFTNTLGAEFSGYWDVSFETVKEKTICLIKVDPCPEPVYLTTKTEKQFYIRVGNTTRPLDMQAAHEYIGMHWHI